MRLVRPRLNSATSLYTILIVGEQSLYTFNIRSWISFGANPFKNKNFITVRYSNFVIVNKYYETATLNGLYAKNELTDWNETSHTFIRRVCQQTKNKFWASISAFIYRRANIEQSGVMMYRYHVTNRLINLLSLRFSPIPKSVVVYSIRVA